MSADKTDCRYVCARAPLRLGLAGGGTDVSPYCDRHGGLILNATIGHYAYAMLKPCSPSILRFAATDLDMQETLEASLPLRPANHGEELALHRGVYNAIMNRFNGGRAVPVELITSCDVPQGSGLGASSTLVVAMVKAFAEFLNLPLDEFDIARLAFEIERFDCGLQGGRQDHYSAAFGGFNYMEFPDAEHASVHPLRLKNWIICDLESSLLLYYTGVSRVSASIIAEQSKRVDSGDERAVHAMHRMREEVPATKRCLLRGDFDGLITSMRNGWEAKKSSASMISNPHIERIQAAATQAGALAGKVSGAGGGGFMLFFVPQERRMEVANTLRQFDGFLTPCVFSLHGVQAWRR